MAFSADRNLLAAVSPNSDGNDSNASHTDVFAWNGLDWVQQGLALHEASFDGFVSLIDLSADRIVLAAGATWNDNNGTNAGMVHAFAWTGSEWVCQGQDLDKETMDDWLIVNCCVCLWEYVGRGFLQQWSQWHQSEPSVDVELIHIHGRFQRYFICNCQQTTIENPS